MTALDRRYDTKIHRRVTRTVMVGDVPVGSEHPIVVQSMINEDTLDIEGSVAGILRLVEAGCEIVRVTTPSIGHAKAMAKIRASLRAQGCTVPLVADVHHNGIKIALEVAKHVDKVRINPGLFVFDKPDPDRQEFTKEEFEAIGARIRETFEPLVTLLRDQNKALRIGVNHGSLAERMLFTYGDTPEGMVESAMEFVRICHELDFHNIVISMKASRAPVMLAAYRLMADTMDKEGFNYPLHLGVTEAGDGDYGVPTDLPWGMAYPDGVVPTTQKVHPAPVYETLSHLVIFAILKMSRRMAWVPGQLVAVYFVLAGIARFGVESIRLNPKVAFGLTEAQIISVILIII